VTLHRQTGPSADFVSSYAQEDLVLQTARGLAGEVGVAPVTAATGALLGLLANASTARTVVEIGTGTGVSGIWLLRGMRADGVLTTIDVEAEYQRMARRLFLEAGFASSRTRVIAGRALEVLPRLSDAAYDLIFVDSDPLEYEAYADAAARLLRGGGMLVMHGVLTKTAAASVATAVRDSDLWSAAVIPIGDGLLAAVRVGTAQ